MRPTQSYEIGQQYATVLDDEIVCPLLHIHQFKGKSASSISLEMNAYPEGLTVGFFSIFDRPHAIDRKTLRPVIIDAEYNPD
jgi:hypothetical protein